MRKNNVNFKERYIKFSLVIVISLVFSSCFINVKAGSSYVPYPPVGVTEGTINVEYKYIVNTIEVGSSWMFDWGDGNFSSWIVFNGSDTFVSQSHSWSDYGVYNVRVKYRSPYMVESPWSPPLIVNISETADTDNDGWKNDVEIAYGTDPENPDEYPIDTDNDGIPDENSSDGKYVGDTDDDNDGIPDILEESLGSNPKNCRDAVTLFLENNVFYVADTNNDGKLDVLYSSGTNLKTSVETKGDKTFLDINGDGSWDYIYTKGDGVIRYNEIPWLYVVVGIILTVLLTVFILFKKGILYIYEEETIVEE